MRSNAGRRTRLRAPRRQDHEAQSLGNGRDATARCNCRLVGPEQDSNSSVRARVLFVGSDCYAALGEDAVVRLEGQQHRVIVKPVNLNRPLATTTRHSQGPQPATVRQGAAL
jgi:hypothetical protein